MKFNSETEEIRTILGRRAFLRGTFASVASVVVSGLLSGCSDASPSPSPTILLTTSTPVNGQAGQTPAQSNPTTTAGNNTTTQAQTTSVVRTTTSVQPATTATNTAITTARLSPTTTGTQSVAAQPATAATTTGSKVLLVYFSRAGENYFNGGRIRLDVGNTEVAANMISQLTGCDVYRIEAADPYSANYSDTVGRNVREQQANARPAIAKSLASIDQYDTILLGSPIWNVRPPMIMTTFVEGFNFKGKTVFPFVTYAVSGLGTTVRDYTASLPGVTIGQGLAVRGEEVKATRPDVEVWLRSIKLLK